ncbi:MAG: nucleotide exchange factor GrpE, partial [bacterium]
SEDIQKLLEEKEAELAEAKNRMIRALADYDNLRKRSESEREEIVKISNEALMQALLPILDNFDRAIRSAEEHQIHEEVLKGFALINQQFQDILKRAGLEEIQAQGQPFDPHFHEAIMTKEDDGEGNKILEVVQKGYTLFGKLLRPSMVIVSKGKS